VIADVLRGSLGFAAVSVAAFSVWAFGPLKGPAMYAAVAVAFLLLSGVALSPLARPKRRFLPAFLPAFTLYAVAWCAAWFFLTFKGRDYVGIAAGGALFTAVLAAVLGGRRAWLRATLVLVAAHALGYWLGGVACYAEGHGKLGMLAWGLGYGLGFGAGIGYVFHAFQAASSRVP